MEGEQKCQCGPGCKCGPNCTCPPGCKGNCGPCGEGCTCGTDCKCPPGCKGNCGSKMCPMGFPPKPFFPVARVLEPAPCFEGQAWFDGMIQNIKLSDYKDKWVVLFFYPFDFTFVCPTEICAFSDASDNLAIYFSKII